MPYTPHELEQISERTLDHYRRNADRFLEGTQDHDVRQNIAALLAPILGEPPFTILDLGCGPGRDLIAFAKLGHRPIGLDGAAQFVAMARAASGCDVWEQDFLKLALPAGRFDGIFANASLFHVPRQELPRVLRELRTALKTEGVLFSSNPRGDDEEGWSGSRFGVHYRLDTWHRLVTDAGFALLTHYYRPEGLPREQQPWLATVWRRVDNDWQATP